jgi:hypothetical protein
VNLSREYKRVRKNMSEFRYSAAVTAFLLFWLAEPGACQDRLLAETVQIAQEAWLRHDVGALVSRSDTVRLHIPDLPPSASLRPGQASRLLDRYLSPTEEISFELLNVRELADDHAYAEVQRVFVVKGTVEEREETVFLGFRLIRGTWSLREVRVTP